MEINNSILTGGVRAVCIAILYGLIKLCRHRHLVLKSGCCSVDVSPDDTPPKVGFPPKPTEPATRAEHFIEKD